MVRILKRRLILALMLVAFALVVPVTPALAQEAGPGVRIGVSGSPAQFYFGAHYNTDPIVDRLSFRPNLEVGLGDDRTSVCGNFEFAYWWKIPDHPWHVYAGGGPAVVVYRFTEGAGGSTDVKAGFNLLLGTEHKSGLFVELKLGLIDSPEVKFGIGYTWGK